MVCIISPIYKKFSNYQNRTPKRTNCSSPFALLLELILPCSIAYNMKCWKVCIMLEYPRQYDYLIN